MGRHSLPVLVCLLLAQTGFLVLCTRKVTISPKRVLAKVGSELTLLCETSCPGVKPRFILLDNIDARQTAEKNKASLHFADIVPQHEGKYVCEANCSPWSKDTAKLIVYNLPMPVLQTEPKSPVSGQPFQVICTLLGVYSSSGNIQIKIFHDKMELRTTISESDDPTSFQNYTSSSADQVGKREMEYRCDASITLDSQIFTNSISWTVDLKAPSTTTPPATTTIPTTTTIPATTTSPTTTTTPATATIPATTIIPATTPATERSSEWDTVHTTVWGNPTIPDMSSSPPPSQRTPPDPWTLGAGGRGPPPLEKATPHPNAIPELPLQPKPILSNNINPSWFFSMETQRAEAADKEGEQRSAEETPIAMYTGSTLGAVATLSFVGCLLHLLRRRKRQSVAEL
ncbi:cell wall protein DAN4-like isoform X2 [Hypomesus transpacificus]|uniref:cell wall protein DAN4-like isoform X2 n=1 Tax=Hypomesus transpacificus TaxID=137520 RepID=UPI001F0875BE|nr:cell wall protein DAN4-like isoform X2 [Hypomesus transpacificus]